MTGIFSTYAKRNNRVKPTPSIKCTISIFDALPEAKGFGSFHSGILGHLLIFVYEPVK